MFNFVSNFVLLLFCTLSIPLKAQTVFSETFDEANNSTSGNDNTNGVAWSATCPTCLSGDYWHIVGGRFEARDTNGEAVWETQPFNVTSCDNVEVSFTLSEAGTMEACGTGCNSADWVAFEYSVDGGAWQSPSNSFFCNGGCAGRNVIAADDLASGTLNYSSGCLPVGNSMRLRITVQCWAADEYWRVDNISAVCACTALPIELLYFDAEADNEIVQLNWYTAIEIDNDYFTVEKTRDFREWEIVEIVDGAGTSLESPAYQAIDSKPYEGLAYYRLRQTDFNGRFDYSNVNSVFSNPKNIEVYPNPTDHFLSLNWTNSETASIKLFDLFGTDLTGKICSIVQTQNLLTLDLSSLSPGTYFIQVETERYTFIKL